MCIQPTQKNETAKQTPDPHKPLSDIYFRKIPQIPVLVLWVICFSNKPGK